MSKLSCIMCMSNVGSVERGKISESKWYSIDRIIVKFSDGRRLTRYAVCVNGTWHTNQQLTKREAHEMVKNLQKEAEEAKYYAMGI